MLPIVDLVPIITKDDTMLQGPMEKLEIPIFPTLPEIGNPFEKFLIKSDLGSFS